MKNNSNLEMRKIPSLQFLYEISEDGRILRNVKSKKQLKPRLNNRGYYFVGFCIKGIRQWRTIHSLVAECWLGNCPDGYEIDHIDRNKINNNYRNLRYVTHSQNNLNKDKLGNKSVIITYQNETLYFGKLKDVAIYISKIKNKPYGTIRWKLSKKRKYIEGFNIKY